MTITICGSMQFYQEMRSAKTTLKALGNIVYVPKGLEDEVPIEAQKDLPDEDVISAKIEYDFIREHFRLIEGSDAILVLNYDKKGTAGYIGGNTFLEMGHAFGLGKKIFLLHPIPEMDYKTEMHAMQPVVIEGDFIKIV